MSDKQDEAAVLFDGVEMSVTYRDKPDTAETIKIKKCEVEEMDKLSAVFGQGMRGEVAFYASRDMEWTKKLTDESFAAVFQEGRQQNFTLYSVWFQGKTQELELVNKNKGLKQIVEAATKEIASRFPQRSST